MTKLLQAVSPAPVRKARRAPERTVTVEIVLVDDPAAQAVRVNSILRIFRAALIRQASAETCPSDS